MSLLLNSFRNVDYTTMQICNFRAFLGWDGEDFLKIEMVYIKHILLAAATFPQKAIIFGLQKPLSAKSSHASNAPKCSLARTSVAIKCIMSNVNNE